ncbi:MAG: helix-turn-helix domain-containing protein [Victivallaceae bacterium]
MLFLTDSVRLTFAEPGKGAWEASGKTNMVHRKSVPYIIIAQPTAGQYRIECGDGRTALINSGEAFLTAPNMPLMIEHICAPETGMMKSRWIHFNFVLFDAVNLASVFELPLKIESEWAGRFGRIAEKMFAIKHSNSNETHSLKVAVRTNELAFAVLRLLIEYLESRGIAPQINPAIMRLLPALEYARQRPARKLNVAGLAKKAHLSVPRFHAEFKRLFGDSPLSYIRKMRLSIASDMLRSGSLSLEEIALQTGFCNQFHFSREFKKCYGSAPSAFRKKNAAGPVF